MGSPSVDLTVVVPLVDPRGLGLTALRAWAREQTADRTRFRVQVMLSRESTHSPAEVRAVLDAADAVVETKGDVGALLDTGARHADSKLVLFTEGHCLPDAACLAELFGYLDAHPEMDGALLGTAHGNQTPLAGFEARMYDAAVPDWIAKAPLHCVKIRGFAIRRETYLAAGGLDASLGFFAEDALSARLRDVGARIGYAGKAIVRHTNTDERTRLRASIAAFVTGELEYARRAGFAAFEANFGSVREASLLAAADWGLAGEGARALLALRPLGWRSRADLVGEAMACGAAALFGRTGLRFLEEARLLKLHALYSAQALLPKGRYETYAALWSSMTRAERLRQAGATVPPEPRAALDADMLAIPHAIGFHGPERGACGPFRWTGPVATVFLRAPAPDFSVDIDARTLPSVSQRERVGFTWLGRAVPAECVSVSEGRWSVDLRDSPDPAELRRLTIACAPIVPRRARVADERRLGLPISSVTTRAR